MSRSWLRVGLLGTFGILGACALPTSGLGIDDRVETSVADSGPVDLAETSAAPDPRTGDDIGSGPFFDDAGAGGEVVAIAEAGRDDDVVLGRGDDDCVPIGDELIVNGGFELPVIGRDSDKYSNDEGFLPGFGLHAVGAWNRFWIENGTPGGVTRPRHFDGDQAICLNADGAANDYVEQRFPTVVGARYQLRFALTDEKNAGPSAAAVRVEVAAAVQTFDRASDDGWQTKTLIFVAEGDSTLLRIVDATPGSAWDHSPFLDAVSIRTCE